MVVVAVMVVGSSLRSGSAAADFCPPSEGVSEPDGSDPEIEGMAWWVARAVLEGEGYGVDVGPSSLDPAVIDDAVVVHWAIVTPVDDVGPPIAVVCLGRVVPDVRGQTRHDAEATLNAAGFALWLPADIGDEWTVIEQSPVAGTLAILETPLELGLVPPPVIVPDNVGHGVVIGEPEGAVDDVIVSQSPAAGDRVPPGRAVDVITEPLVQPTTIPPAATPQSASVTTAPVVTAASSSTSTWTAVAGVGTGAASAVAAGGLLVARHQRGRWRRRVTTVSWSEPLASTVVNDGPGHVVHVEWTVDQPVERVEERCR